MDHVPGPRGPVTFEDLCLRQYVITPAGNAVDGQPSAAVRASHWQAGTPVAISVT